jgi:predicted ATPase/class 3 adenylate cyclase
MQDESRASPPSILPWDAVFPRAPLTLYDLEGDLMPDLPIGTVTFLFTDIEGSTNLARTLGDRWAGVLEDHSAILRRAVRGHAGVDIRTEGDALFAVFTSAVDAVAACADAQRDLAGHHWPEDGSVQVRMGLHTGEGRRGGDEYVGLDVHRAARISAAAHGGQVLISEGTAALVGDQLPEGVGLRDLGLHRLKDFQEPQRIYQLVVEDLPSEFGPVRTLEVPTNLPPQRTSFVGRDREMAEVADLLSKSRLVTLTGPGGTGKTRLAIEVASDQLDRFPDGVFFADLSPIVDPALVPPVIAQALVVREDPGREMLDTFADHLRDRHVLLVLDNFEQVAISATLVARLLDAAPKLTVLVTSRIPLHLSGEHEYAVPPLALPDLEHLPDRETLMSCEAVALLVERASAVRAGFQLGAQDASAVAQIAARLDGLPLAIELAAGRLKLLTPQALLARLVERLPLLTGGARDLPERQRTLRGTIEWSHDLLSADERRLFARLSAFAGGWTLESAEAVCGPGLGVDVLEGLGALVDASLVRHLELGDGEPRFTMLETIREYATDQLRQSGEEPELRRRHAEHFRDLAERYDPGFFFRIGGAGKEQGDRSLHLDRENDNVRAALGWAADGGDVVTGLRTAAALSWYWQHRGHFADGRGLLERLLSVRDGTIPPAVRVRALLPMGDIAFMQGDRTSAQRTYQEAVDTARAIGDPPLLAWALLDLADIPTWEEDYDGAEAMLMESLATAEEGGDRIVASEVRAVLGRLAYFRGDFAAAGELYQEAIAAQGELGADRFLAINVGRLADVEVQMGELDSAEGHYRESLAKVAEAGNVVITAVMLVYLAWVAGRRSAHGRAARLLGAVKRIQDEIGGGPTRENIPVWPETEDEARRGLGDEAFEQARAEGYAMSLEEAVSYATGEGDDPAVVRSVTDLGDRKAD